jgi:3-(3-hydroxy-phenyl)propionate hydroxylase
VVRPAGRGELESLYFDYPTFEYRQPPEARGERRNHPVVIVGAGPVGLTAALELGRRGIPCVVLDNKRTVNDGSRAICISRNSFETLQQLGVAERFEREALGWTQGRTYYRDKLVYRLEMPHSDNERYLPMYNLQQQYIEQFLVEHARTFGSVIDLRWGSEVETVEDQGDQVRLGVRTPDGTYPMHGAWVIAADGAHSRVRGALGLRLNDRNLPGHYVIADVRMSHDFPTERRAFFASSAHPEATVLIHRQPHDIWRIDWQLLPGQDPDEAVCEANVRERIQSILNMIGHRGPWDLEWWSIYTANTLCLDDYRHGRILFVGDAAHIVPIFGVRGLNNGLTDAVNAAWKLAYVLDGTANPGLLDSYSPERRGATLDVFRNATKRPRFMTPPSRGYALMRDAALQIALSESFTRRFADPRQVVPYTYRDSPLTTTDVEAWPEGGGICAGDVAINRRLCAGSFLCDHLGAGFTGLYFTTAQSVPRDVLQARDRLQAIDPAFQLRVVARHALDLPNVDVLVDEDARVFAAYATVDGSFYLIRPDRHVAARWRHFEGKAVERALRKSLGHE